MVGKRAAVPNRSELGVPNGSELSKVTGARAPADAAHASGRPPVLTDDQLDALAIKLNDSLGRPPRLEELIAESGGCQRQRAGRAIQRLREDLAANSVRSTLVLPPELESQMRQWIERLMSVAAKQLAVEHARLIHEHDQNESASKELIHEQQFVVMELREQLADQTRIGTELLLETQRLKTTTAQLSSERDIAIALADDRLKLLEKLSR